jgi:hypothetical protein
VDHHLHNGVDVVGEVCVVFFEEQRMQSKSTKLALLPLNISFLRFYNQQLYPSNSCSRVRSSILKPESFIKREEKHVFTHTCVYHFEQTLRMYPKIFLILSSLKAKVDVFIVIMVDEKISHC